VGQRAGLRHSGEHVEGLPPIQGGEDDPDALREEIAETRSELSETVDAIQERLSPEHVKEQVDALKDQATDTIREATVGKAEQMVTNVQETVKGTGKTTVETIKANPLPAALVAVGIGWLIKESRSSAARRSTSFPSPSGVSQTADQLQDIGGELVGRVQSTTSQMTTQVQSQTSQVQRQMSQVSTQAQQQAQQLARQARQRYQENPLAMGGAALALGAVVGLLVPETPQEEQLLGQSARTLVDKAQTAAQETMQKVQSVAEEAKGAVQQEAKQQGLGS
jgi:ElaB/YqjD/DUF883 family membrane-anchored ribosome-binding protein